MQAENVVLPTSDPENIDKIGVLLIRVDQHERASIDVRLLVCPWRVDVHDVHGRALVKPQHLAYVFALLDGLIDDQAVVADRVVRPTENAGVEVVRLVRIAQVR